MVHYATEVGFVSEHHQRLAEIIADYDPNLRLAFIPEGQRDLSDPNEKPFAVIDMGGGERMPHPIMFADACDEKLLARIFTNDTHKVDVRARLDAEENARQIIAMKDQLDRHEHMEDVVKTLGRKSF